MSNCVYPLIVYNNESISVMLFKMYDSKAFLLAKKIIYNGSIDEIVQKSEYVQIAKLINQAFKKFEEKTGEKCLDIYLAIEPDNFYISQRKFGSDFSEGYILEQIDIEKVCEKAKKYEKAEDGFTVTSFIANKVTADNQMMRKIIGKNIRQLQLDGEIVYIDTKTFDCLDRILEETHRNLADYIITNHYLKYSPGFENNDVIIEIEASRMNFIVRKVDGFKNFRIKIGLGHVYTKMYEKLLERTNQENAQIITLFLQKHFLINPLEFDYEIVEGITVNEMVEFFNQIFNLYMLNLFANIHKQGIAFEKLHILSYGYENGKLVELFNRHFGNETVVYNLPNYGNIQKPDSKIYLAVQKYDEFRIF
ncbi:MAG: hypothetical protein ACRCUP_00880 [Mycoplasmatales bacterium]